MSQQLIEFNILETSVEAYLESLPEIQELKNKIEPAVAASKKIIINDVNDLNSAAHYVKNFDTINKALEAGRLHITKPLLDKKKEIDEYFKKLNLLFSEEQERLEGEILSWKKQQELIAKQKAELARIQAEEEAIQLGIKKEKELQTKAILEGKDPGTVHVEVPIVPEIIPVNVKLSSKNTSGVSTMQVKKWRVIDVDKIPEEYFVLDEKKINAIRRSASVDAVSSIPGIEFYSEDTLRKG